MTNLLGKSIRLFLVDGTPQGLMTLEVVNWTGHILTAPRSKIAELIKREEMNRTGVYFLSGPDPEGNSEKPVVYIGESDNVGNRLAQHNKDEDKQFWERACIITSKDQNLTKAHAKYLESRLITIAEAAGLAKLANGTAPAFDRLPEGDIADMEYFISQIRLVLPVVGLDILRDKPRISANSKQPGAKFISNDEFKASPTFEIQARKHGIKALAKEVDGDFILLAGSETQPKWIGVTDDGYKKRHDAMLADKKIIVDTVSQKGVVQEDVVFSSPSAAAAVVLGRASNGRTEWKLQGTSKTYQDWQDEQLAVAMTKAEGF